MGEGEGGMEVGEEEDYNIQSVMLGIPFKSRRRSFDPASQCVTRFCQFVTVYTFQGVWDGGGGGAGYGGGGGGRGRL